MKSKIASILAFAVVLIEIFVQSAFAQTKLSSAQLKFVETILDTALNSAPFKTIYKDDCVLFKANELLTEDSPLVLYSRACKVQIRDATKIRPEHSYVVLGDFTVDWNSPHLNAVRIQLTILPSNTDLNMTLVKRGKAWVIKSYVISND